MEPQDSSLDIPRPELIKKLMGYISEAQKTPLSELCKTGDYANNELTFPQTKGEYLEYEMLNLLLDQSWIDGESEPVLDEMLSVLGPLDVSVNQPKGLTGNKSRQNELSNWYNNDKYIKTGGILSNAR